MMIAIRVAGPVAPRRRIPPRPHGQPTDRDVPFTRRLL